MTDRGEWRGIRSVLIDGKDYQALKPNARLVLLTLKLTCGQAGICVMPAMNEVLSERTGLSVGEVVGGLDELAEAGWIRIERNIVWIIDGLKHEPGYFPNNSFHQRGLLKYLDSLPRLQIVEDFRKYYSYLPGLSPTGEVSPEAGDNSTVESVLRAPDTSEVITPEEPAAEPPAKRRAKPAVETWVQEGTAWWTEKVGSVGYARFGKAIKPFVDKYGWERVRPALEVYAHEMWEQGKPSRVEWFAAEAVTRIEKKPPVKSHTHTQGVKPWQQDEHDRGLASQPQIAEGIKAYKRQLNGGGDAWWETMKREAKSKNRHPIAYAHEWIQEAFRGD